jgi:hypothetical protein
MYEISLVDDSFAGLGVKAAGSGNGSSSGSGEVADGGTDNDEAPKKRRKGGETPANTTSDGAETGNISSSSSSTNFTLLDSAAIDQIRTRLEAYDKLREDVIKQSRDVQKLSKQAIFAVHRGNIPDCRSKLNQALSAATKIMDIINQVKPGFSNLHLPPRFHYIS